MIDRIEARVLLLAEQPRLGVRRHDIRDSVRMLVEGPYLVLYETTPDRDEGSVTSLEVVRVVDGRRELAGLV
jgi:toxin ParE1/3/4